MKSKVSKLFLSLVALTCFKVQATLDNAHNYEEYQSAIAGKILELEILLEEEHDEEYSSAIASKLLESETCFKMEKQFSDYMVNLTGKYDEETIKGFMCNAIERQILMDTLEGFEEDIKKGEDDPCVKAYKYLALRFKDQLEEQLSSETACKSEIVHELHIEEEDDRHMKEIGDNNQRQLPLVFLPFVGTTATISVKLAIKLAAIGAFSDRNLKQNIHLVGTSPSGINVYTFQYIPGIEKIDANLNAAVIYSGVMAQELEDNYPEAIVIGKDGFYRVDYSKIDVDFHQLTKA